MGKYTDLQEDVFSVFGSVGWQAENLKTYPSNYVANSNGNEFLRVNVIPGAVGVNRISASGVVLIEIFTESGVGPSRYFAIADILDRYLENKSFSLSSQRSTQFETSTLSGAQPDKDNPALCRVLYTIPFNFFGVF